MTSTHIHLVLNHVPIIGIVIGTLLLAYALLRRDESIGKSALIIFIATAVVAGIVYLTGEGAEEAVEHLPGISHDSIEAHEAAAFIGIIAATILGLVSMIGIVMSWRKPLARVAGSTSFAIAIVTIVIMTWVGFLGGRIHHTELLPETVTSSAESELDRR